MRGSRSANTASATGAPGIMAAAISASPSMQEVTFAGEDHCEAELVGTFDDDVVAHRAAGLHHHRDARGCRSLDAVGERIERVARARATGGAAGRLLRRDLARLDPVLLTRADADGLAVLHEHDRVRLHVTTESPRELGVGPLLGGGRHLGDDPPVVAPGGEVRGVLDEEPTADLAE